MTGLWTFVALAAEGRAAPADGGPVSPAPVALVGCRAAPIVLPAVPPAAGRAHAVSWDQRGGGWVVDGLHVPIVDRAEILEAWGLRAGPDGRPWLAGGEVTVLVDGRALGDGMGGLVPEARLQPMTQEPWALRR